MNRLPNKVQHHMTSKIRSKARELLGEERYATHFSDLYRLFVVDAAYGRTSYTNKTVTVPHWSFSRPESSCAVRKLGYNGPLLESYWIYYLAHELAHVISKEEFGEGSHGASFMKVFISICPAELQFFELGYKPRNAKAAGISL